MSAHTASLQAGQESYECIGKECYDKCSPWAKKLIDRKIIDSKIKVVSLSIFQQIAHFFLTLFSPQYKTAYNWKLDQVQFDPKELENMSDTARIRDRTRSFSDLKTACVTSFLSSSDQQQIKAIVDFIGNTGEDQNLYYDSAYAHTVEWFRKAKELLLQSYMQKEKIQDVFASQEDHPILSLLLSIYETLTEEIQNVLEEKISTILLEGNDHPILAHLLDHYKTLPDAMQKTLQGHVRAKIQERTEDPFTTLWKNQEEPAFTIDMTVSQATDFSLESAHIGTLTIKGKLQEKGWGNILSSKTVRAILWEKSGSIHYELTREDAEHLEILTKKGLVAIEARDYELHELFSEAIVKNRYIHTLKLERCTGEIQHLLQRAIHQKEHPYKYVELINTKAGIYPGGDSVTKLVVDQQIVPVNTRKEGIFGKKVTVPSTHQEEKKQNQETRVPVEPSSGTTPFETQDTETVVPLPSTAHPTIAESKEEASIASGLDEIASSNNEEEPKGELSEDHSPIEADAPLPEEYTAPQAEGKETDASAIETPEEETESNHPELNAEVGTNEKDEEGSDAGSEEDVTRIGSDLTLLFKDSN